MGVFHNANELRDALQKIRDECESHSSCSACPFQTKNGTTEICGISGIDVRASGKYVHKPRYWKLARISLFIPGECKEE